ncbi:CocE/NonD family hydrolase [Candidatus Latescibacterota bacterium]
MRRFFLLISLIMIASCLNTANADDRADYIRSHYTKFEYRIPMRDGVKLFTAVYIPNDASKEYPVLMLRTPYSVGPYDADRYKTRLGPSEKYEQEGFIFVFQDVRGRFMSEGIFVNMTPHVPVKKGGTVTNESTDTYDTIEWLLEHLDTHNGNVGMWGISYPGFFAQAGAIDSHPALKAVSPQAPVSNFWGDDIFHNGALYFIHIFRFFGRFGIERNEPTTEWPERPKYLDAPDAYRFFLELGPLKNANKKYFKNDIEFWNKIANHPNYDSFWKQRNIIPHLKNIKAAVLMVGGWYDCEDLYGPLKSYHFIEKNNPGIFNSLVMGPWQHGGWAGQDGSSLGDAEFGFATSKYYNDNILFPFFKNFLIEPDEDYSFPEARIFETGANRWRSFETWPPALCETHQLYLEARGTLSFKPPSAKKDAGDSYISDPSKPVPFTSDLSARRRPRFMAEDQRFTANRPDVLVYQTEPIEDDLTLAGPIQANLFVSTTGTDSDFIVKLVDVYPDSIPGFSPKRNEPDPRGQQLLVRTEVIRGRFRESLEKPIPFVPGEITGVSLELQDVLHTFKRGHRIMVHVQSTWFPMVDRNPQTFVPNIFKADEKDFVTVTNTIYRSKDAPSHIEIGVLPGP